jgi:ABC-type polysaccharide/polyol phosphate export permease
VENAMRAVVVVVTLALLDGLLANLVWRVVGGKHRGVRFTGRALGVVFSLANLLIAALCLVYLWRHGWDWPYVVALVVGLVFAFRFGGTVSGSYD